MKGTTKPMVKKTKVKQKSSPYSDKPVQKWGAITDKLLEIHPLKSEEIKDIVLKSWDDIFNSKIGSFKIGKELFPPFQIMSFMLHELIAHYIQKKHPKQFQVGKEKTEKDIHCITDVGLSIEIKASSDKSHVFANRSYAQPQTTKKAKNKDGYYITVNCEKFNLREGSNNPKVLLIRFGYIEHGDWKPQKSEKGQQASLSKEAYEHKLKVIYQAPN